MRSLPYRIIRLVEPNQRWGLAGLVVILAASGAIEAIGAGSILPLLALLAAPEMVLPHFPFPQISAMTGLSSAHDLLVLLCLVALGLIVFGQALKALGSYLSIRFARRQELSLAARIFRSRIFSSYESFLHKNAAELGRSTLEDAELLALGVIVPLLQVIAQGFVFLCMGLLLLAINPAATLLMAGAIGGSYGLIVWFARSRIRSLGKERDAAATARHKATNEAFAGIKETKLLGIESFFLKQMERHSAVYARNQAASSILAEAPRFVLEALVFGVMVGLLLLIVDEPGNGLASVLPTMGFLAFAGIRLFPALQVLYAAINNLNFNRNVLDRIETELSVSPAAMPDRVEQLPPIPLLHELRLVEASYRYPEARRASIEGLSLEIPAYSTIGIVGKTGAGKTTLLDLLLGLLRPHEGKLVVDGVLIEGDLNRRWQRSIGYVPQQIFLADDTIRANIALGIDPREINEESLRRAARLAQLDDYVCRELPQGYDTLVGDRGLRLSGGQRQRIGIARALYHNPSLVVFDEATNSLDPQTERAVMDAVLNVKRSKTTIIVSHRLSSLRHCDMIIVMDGGRCIASGTYADLQRQSDRFRELFDVEPEPQLAH